MDKHIFLLLGVLILVVSLNLSDGAGGKMPALLAQCKASENATDEDMANLKNHLPPQTETMKCLITCLGEKSGKIVSHKLSTEGILNSIKNSPTYNDQMQQSVIDIVNECSAISDPDRCENGSKAMACLMDGATKHGIKAAFHPHRQQKS